MKLPLNSIIAPVIKKYFNESKGLCLHPAFLFSSPYTYVYSLVGVLLSANHLRKHIGEVPPSPSEWTQAQNASNDFMLIHDLKIIATSLGLIQYACLLAGCYTENPSLFLPHLLGQIFVVVFKIVNALLLMSSFDAKSYAKLKYRVPAIFLIIFNWTQEFCLFRQFLCICDL